MYLKGQAVTFLVVEVVEGSHVALDELKDRQVVWEEALGNGHVLWEPYIEVEFNHCLEEVEHRNRHQRKLVQVGLVVVTHILAHKGSQVSQQTKGNVL